jgi:hypothetical protein
MKFNFNFHFTSAREVRQSRVHRGAGTFMAKCYAPKELRPAVAIQQFTNRV